MFLPIFGAFNIFLVLVGLTIIAIFSALVLFFLFRRNEKIAKTAAVVSAVLMLVTFGWWMMALK
jgi:LPXTG-motif cell wall-anchored protein